MTEKAKLIEIFKGDAQDAAGNAAHKITLIDETPASPPESFLEQNGRRMTLQEAATTYSSTFPQLLTADLRATFFNEYDGIPMTYAIWCDTMRSNKPDEVWLKDSPLGVAPIVGEGDPYPRVELNLAEAVSIANNKYGFIIPVSKEAIEFDKYNIIRQRTMDRARSMAYTKEGLAYAVITTAANFARTTAAGDNDIGNNTAATTFSATGLMLASKTLRTMKDATSGVYLGVQPNILICGVGVEWAANQLLLSPTLSGMGETDALIVHGQGTTNPLRGFVPQILVTPFLGQYEWVLMQSRRAVVMQQVWDLNLVQTGETNEGWFNRDELEFKVSEFFGVGMLDSRFAYYSSSTTTPTVT